MQWKMFNQQAYPAVEVAVGISIVGAGAGLSIVGGAAIPGTGGGAVTAGGATTSASQATTIVGPWGIGTGGAMDAAAACLFPFFCVEPE